MIGALPPGIDPGLMEANIITSVAIPLNLAAWVRFNAVEMHMEESPESVRDKLQQRLQSKLKLTT